MPAVAGVGTLRAAAQRASQPTRTTLKYVLRGEKKNGCGNPMLGYGSGGRGPIFTCSSLFKVKEQSGCGLTRWVWQ